MAAHDPDTQRFISERENARTILSLRNGHCRLKFFGETTPDQIEDVFAKAAAAGITNIGDSILRDFTHFTGIIDWDFARKRKIMAPFMESQPSKVAYVMRDEHAALTARAIILWLKKFDCQIFLDIEKAENWLGWR